MQAEAASCKFAHLKDSGAHLELTEGGRRVTKTRDDNNWDWASVGPGAKDGVTCWHVKVHAGGSNLVIGVIAVSTPGKVNYGPLLRQNLELIEKEG